VQTNHTACSAAAAHRQAKEKEEQQKRIQQAQQKQEEKENNREKMAKQHHQENVDLAKKTNEINNRMLRATVRIGVATLIIAFVGMVFAVLSFFKS
jgi:preprotein translocase subunit SecF